MLVARTKNRSLVVLDGQKSRRQLRKWRKEETFYCPQCEEEVVLKVGTKRTPHFAHTPQTRCHLQFAEGESEEHLRGKLQLYHFFRQHSFVELEPLLKTIQQRPDLLVKWQKKRYAIEFQRSVISLALFQQRDQTYRQHGYQPLWIWKTPMKWKKEGVQLINVTTFEQLFFQRRRYLFETITYDPSTFHLTYVQLLFRIKRGRYIGKIVHLPLRQQRLPFLRLIQWHLSEVKQALRLYEKWRIRSFHQMYRYNREGIHHPLFRYMYDARYPLGQWPSYIGVPIEGQHEFESFDSYWQAASLLGWPIAKTAEQRTVVDTYMRFVESRENNETDWIRYWNERIGNQKLQYMR